MNRSTVVVLGAVMLALASGTASAKIFQYKARLAKPVEKDGPVRASVFNWTCSGNACSINGPWAKPGVGHCKALAKAVGEITAFGHSEAKLDEQQLEECNSVVPAVESP